MKLVFKKYEISIQKNIYKIVITVLVSLMVEQDTSNI
jgi:hypothetical protein